MRVNSINNYGFNFPVGMNLSGLNYPLAFSAGNVSGSGDVDIYTCPTGKRALCFGIIGFNTAGTSTTCQAEIYVSGTYYKLDVTQSFATTANIGFFLNFPIILEAGERLSVNATQAGMTLFGTVIEFDNTCGMKTSKVVSLSSGDNIIYTVPANKTAFVLDRSGSLNLQGTRSYGYYNNSGGTRTLNSFIVNSGGSTGSTNKIQNNVSSTTSTLLNNNLTFCSMNAGDFFVVNTDASTATQTCWINVLEV